MSTFAVLALVFAGWVVAFFVAIEVVTRWLGTAEPCDDDWGNTAPAPPPVRSDTPVYDRVVAERAVETAALERLWDE